jgi:hypothetical protein
MEPARLGAELANLAGRVGALERRQVDHRQGELERLELRVLLDRARAKARHSFFDADLIDRRRGLLEGERTHRVFSIELP